MPGPGYGYFDRPEQAIANSKNSQSSSFLNFPLNIGAHSILLAFNKYAFVPPGERGLNSLDGGSIRNRRAGGFGPIPRGTDVIQLPLPANIQDTYNVRTSGNDLGVGGGYAAEGAAGFAGAGDITAGALGGILGNALPQVNWQQILNPDLDQASKNVSFLGRRAIDSLLSGAGRAVDQGLGNTVNPKSSLFFEGVNLKQFDFSWTLAPTESAESNRIRDIITTIRRNILPTYGSAVGLNKVLLNYPSTVDIFFLGIDDSYFFKYKTCMVQQFQNNYTPNGLAIVTGGKPAMVSMNMTLMEMDIHTSEDYGGVGSGTGATISTEDAMPLQVTGAR